MNSSVATGIERSAILASHRDLGPSHRPNPLRYIRFGVLVCLVGALSGGCIFSPEKGKKVIPPVVYPKRNTPQNALLFLRKAWESKDSLQIAAVYADDYAGSSIDLTDPGSTTLDFAKSDEVHAVHWLAINQNITFLQMELYSKDSWIEVHYAGDPSDWVTLQIPHFKIEVRDLNNNGYVATDSGDGETWIFEFTLRPTGPPSDPIWEIVKWTESRAKI